MAARRCLTHPWRCWFPWGLLCSHILQLRHYLSRRGRGCVCAKFTASVRGDVFHVCSHSNWLAAAHRHDFSVCTQTAHTPFSSAPAPPSPMSRARCRPARVRRSCCCMPPCSVHWSIAPGCSSSRRQGHPGLSRGHNVGRRSTATGLAAGTCSVCRSHTWANGAVAPDMTCAQSKQACRRRSSG